MTYSDVSLSLSANANANDRCLHSTSPLAVRPIPSPSYRWSLPLQGSHLFWCTHMRLFRVELLQRPRSEYWRGGCANGGGRIFRRTNQHMGIWKCLHKDVYPDARHTYAHTVGLIKHNPTQPATSSCVELGSKTRSFFRISVSGVGMESITPVVEQPRERSPSGGTRAALLTGGVRGGPRPGDSAAWKFRGGGVEVQSWH